MSAPIYFGPQEEFAMKDRLYFLKSRSENCDAPLFDVNMMVIPTLASITREDAVKSMEFPGYTLL